MVMDEAGGLQLPRLTVPMDIVWHEDLPMVTLGEISQGRLEATFWDDAISRHARRNALVQLDSIPLDDRPLGVAGTIHHMTRCGSTALLRQFSALDRVFSLSEPLIFIKLLARASADPDLDVARVRRLVSLFRDGLAPIADRLVVKWPTLLCRSAAVLAEALPGVPTVFIHRRPEEVLASIEANPLGKVDALPPHLMAGPGEDTLATGAAMSGIGAVARALATNCRWIAQADGVRRLDYADLPEAGWRDVAPFFGFVLSAAQSTAMSAEAARDAKNPRRTFVPDSARKRKNASVEARRLAVVEMAPALAEVTARLLPVGTCG
jgi:hypothetical protein